MQENTGLYSMGEFRVGGPLCLKIVPVLVVHWAFSPAD